MAHGFFAMLPMPSRRLLVHLVPGHGLAGKEEVVATGIGAHGDIEFFAPIVVGRVLGDLHVPLTPGEGEVAVLGYVVLERYLYAPYRIRDFVDLSHEASG